MKQTIFGMLQKRLGYDRMDVVRPYLLIRNAIKQTGEIYFENGIAETDDINAYNAQQSSAAS